MMKLRILVCGILAVASSTNSQSPTDWSINGLGLDALTAVLEHADGMLEHRNPAVVIWVRLDDLSCGACLDDFAAISAVVHSAAHPKKKKILYLVERDHRPFEVLKRVVAGWKQLHSISSPVLIVEGLRKLGLQKTCVLIRRDGIYQGEYMPMTHEKRVMIISRIVD